MRAVARNVLKLYHRSKEVPAWKRRGYSSPSPNVIKRQVLLRHNLEPKLFARAKERFRSTPNVEIIKDVSEAALPTILERISGNLCLWLDGHYSAGGTYKGMADTPIKQELEAVRLNLGRFAKVHVLVDDVRLFGTDPAYPTLDYLVDWCRANGFSWTIEHDIFIARPRSRAEVAAAFAFTASASWARASCIAGC
jgi:hypothetical protein